MKAFLGSLVLLVAALTGVVTGQEPTITAGQNPQTIPSGTYEPFGAWQHLQLGATTLVNPKAAETSAVVNAYPAQEALARLKPDEFVAKYKAGQIVVATKKDGKYEVLRAATDPSAVFEALKSGKDKQSLVLSYERLGSGQSSRFIGWADKTQPF